MRQVTPGFLEYIFNALRSDNLAEAEVTFFFICIVKRKGIVYKFLTYMSEICCP
jgi:hypothetical protein